MADYTTKRRQIQEEVQLLQAMTLAISESQDFQTALGVALRQVCESTGWKYGEVWIPRLDGSALECSPVWYGSTNNLEKFRKLSEAFTFPVNVGLPGRVWSSKQIEWIEDVTQEPDSIFLRCQIALEPNLKAGLGIPILDRDLVLAVLVFFMFESRPEDSQLVELVSAVTAHLGVLMQQKRTEEVLKTQALVLQSMIEGVNMCDEHGVIFFTNGAFDTMFGYEPGELIGKHISAINAYSPTENARIIAEINENLATQGAWFGELRNCKKDGTEFITYVRLSELKISGKKYWVAVREDITERKRAEQALIEERNFVSAILDTASALVVVLDRHGQIVRFNRACEKITGYTLNEVKGEYVWDIFLLPEELVDVKETFQELADGKLANEHENYWVIKNGSRRLIAWSNSTLFDPDGSLKYIIGTGIDITDRKRAEEALRQAESKYRSIFENAVEGIFQTTIEGHYMIANPMLAKIYGYDSPQELLSALTDIEHQLYVEPNRRAEFMRLVYEQGAVWGFESQVYCKNGRIIWISENAYALYDADGKLVGYEGTVVDITERKQAEALIQYQAFHDLLTNLPNRTLFKERLSVSLANANMSRNRVAVMFLDLDNFKSINDTLGHSVGDHLLQAVAQKLRSCLREGDTVARWGGDEFTVLLPRITSMQEIAKVAQRILDVFREPFHLDEQEVVTSTSIGIAIYPQDGEDIVTLLKNADVALYKAKGSGRNNYHFYIAATSFPSAMKTVRKLKA